MIHWGQRKLLLSEIEFLTVCLRELLVPDPPVSQATPPVETQTSSFSVLVKTESSNGDGPSVSRKSAITNRTNGHLSDTHIPVKLQSTLFLDGPQSVVVYAGAAPGTHIQLLSSMFPGK